MRETNISIPFDQLGAPAQRALKNAGYTNLMQLATMYESDVATLHGIGPSAIKTLRRALAANNMSFKTNNKEKAVK